MDKRPAEKPWTDPGLHAMAALPESHGPSTGPRFYSALTILLLAAAIGSVLWRAWVCDDAFITFRHVSNCLAGYGPVFNPGERVQGFTHPLWFLLLLGGATFLDVYAVAVWLGILSTAGIVGVLAWFYRGRPYGWLILLASASFLFGSNTFVEFQTAGLETSLTNLLLVLLFGVLLRYAEGSGSPPVLATAWLCSLLVLTRPDHVLLCGPLLAWTLWRGWGLAGWRGRDGVTAALLPMVGWYGFATLYYGTPLPNTAYAKLALPFPVTLPKGFHYVIDYTLWEPCHAILIGLVLVVAAGWLLSRLRADRRWAATVLLVGGTWVQLLYVIAVGGDFMRGRLMLPAMIAATMLGGHVLAGRCSTTDCNRAVTGLSGASLLLACTYGLVHPMQWLFGLAVVGYALRDCVVSAGPLAGIGIVSLLMVAGAAGIRRSGGTRRGAAIFVLLSLLCLLYLAGLFGMDSDLRKSWAPFIAIGLALWLGSIAAGLFVSRYPLRPTAVVLAAILAAAVSSLADPIPRVGKCGGNNMAIADEWAFYVGRWDSNRFREPQLHRAPDADRLVSLGRDLARYSRRVGPITVAYNVAGILPYHAGPQVRVLDMCGLTDAFVARCASDPTSRIGHIEHDVPVGYLQMRGVAPLFDWTYRACKLDPELLAETAVMASRAKWDDAAGYECWQRVDRMISGPVLTWARLREIPAYILWRGAGVSPVPLGRPAWKQWYERIPPQLGS